MGVFKGSLNGVKVTEFVQNKCFNQNNQLSRKVKFCSNLDVAMKNMKLCKMKLEHSRAKQDESLKLV